MFRELTRPTRSVMFVATQELMSKLEDAGGMFWDLELKASDCCWISLLQTQNKRISLKIIIKAKAQQQLLVDIF